MFKLSGEEVVWRADSWLFINSAGGDVSILMPEKVILTFASFLRSIPFHPDGHTIICDELKFDSENIEHYAGETSVVILVGGDSFVWTFRLEIEELEDFASYLEAHCEDAEDAA